MEGKRVLKFMKLVAILILGVVICYWLKNFLLHHLPYSNGGIWSAICRFCDKNWVDERRVVVVLLFGILVGRGIGVYFGWRARLIFQMQDYMENVLFQDSRIPHDVKKYMGDKFFPQTGKR